MISFTLNFTILKNAQKLLSYKFPSMDYNLFDLQTMNVFFMIIIMTLLVIILVLFNNILSN